jgi:putative phage-type endonuclease
MTAELVQGSEAWRLARAGSLGASQIGDAMAKTKTGWGASRENLQATLVVERLTGKPVNGYKSQAMIEGTEREPQARAAYSFHTNAEVVEVGLVPHPTINNTHASPDGLIGNAGVLEIKCPEHKAHLDFLLTTTIPQKYALQCQWQMACTGRAWADLAFWHPDFPPAMQLAVCRVQRDDKLIAELEHEARVFLAEVAAKVEALTERYGQRAA